MPKGDVLFAAVCVSVTTAGLTPVWYIANHLRSSATACICLLPRGVHTLLPPDVGYQHKGHTLGYVLLLIGVLTFCDLEYDIAPHGMMTWYLALTIRCRDAKNYSCDQACYEKQLHRARLHSWSAGQHAASALASHSAASCASLSCNGCMHILSCLGQVTQPNIGWLHIPRS